MNKSYTHYTNIGKFISNVNGNWRNSVYITCSVCDLEKQSCCDDLLLSFDGDGIPSFITVTDANYIFATIIDKSECLVEMSNAICRCLFENHIKKFAPEERNCPFLQLVQKNDLIQEYF